MTTEVTKMTEEEALEQISRNKDTIHRKLKFQQEVEAQKKDAAAGFRATLKEIKEEIKFYCEEIEQLESYVKELHGTSIIEQDAQKLRGNLEEEGWQTPPGV